MDIIFFYLIACLPLFAAAGFWVFNKNVVLVEALALASIGFIIAAIFHGISIHGMTADVQTLSGQINTGIKHSAWEEGYLKEIYRTEYYTESESRSRTVGTGKNQRTEYYTVQVRKSKEVFDHCEPRTRHHSESYSANDTFGRSYGIDQSRYDDIRTKHGDIHAFPGDRSNYGYRERANHMIGGDPNDYGTTNKNAYVYPVTEVLSWENKVKACPSTFSYTKVPEDLIPQLFEYPTNNDTFTSDRLVGAASWNITAWDQMNARLGPVKKVNVIAVNFGINADQGLATWLESYWVGGKKNDLVICFGGGSTVTKPTWCHTFGWTEQEIVKRNIDTIVLENGIFAQTIPIIERQIELNYKLKDWSKFDYLTVEVPMSYFVWCLAIELLIMGIGISIAILNNFDKKSSLT